MGSYLSSSGALPRYNGCPPRSPSRGDAGPLSKYFLFDFTLFCFCGYFLSDTKSDLKPSRLQRYLDILVRFQHHLVPGPGRQAPETSRCHPSLDYWCLPRHINYEELFALLDRVLLSATETALTRAAGDERRQPCRGGRVYTHPWVVSRVIPAKGRPGFRAVSARGTDGRGDGGESGWG